MFTGIIQAKCPVASVETRENFCRFSVQLPLDLATGLEKGASVAIDGCCQTVTEFETSEGAVEVWFDAMEETLKRTTLSELATDQSVNIERAARFGQEIGGHELSGHIDATIDVVSVNSSDDNHVIRFQLPDEFRAYVFNKGYLAIHGASLTVSDYDKSNGQFSVYLIPETLSMTNLGTLAKGARANLEIDRRTQVIVDTVAVYLSESDIHR